MGDTAGRALLAFGAGTAGALALWWLWKARDGGERERPDPSSFQRPVGKVAKLYIYPVKSCGRVELSTARCGVRGLKYDRCWVVSKDGQLITQRQSPSIALICPRLEVLHSGEEREQVILHLSAPGMPEIAVREPPPNTPTEDVRVWRSSGEGVDVGREVSVWLEQYLGQEGYKIYYMSPRHKARVLLDDPRWADVGREGEVISFADSTPLLVASEASLQLLNSHTDSAIPMDRFRANIIITGCRPHEEDEWREVRVGDSVILTAVIPCSRCKQTTVDQQKGEFAGPEPLETLGKYRMYETVYDKKDSRFGPLFGFKFGVLQTGTISVGDTVACK